MDQYNLDILSSSPGGGSVKNISIDVNHPLHLIDSAFAGGVFDFQKNAPVMFLDNHEFKLVLNDAKDIDFDIFRKIAILFTRIRKLQSAVDIDKTLKNTNVKLSLYNISRPPFTFRFIKETHDLFLFPVTLELPLELGRFGLHISTGNSKANRKAETFSDLVLSAKRNFSSEDCQDIDLRKNNKYLSILEERSYIALALYLCHMCGEKFDIANFGAVCQSKLVDTGEFALDKKVVQDMLRGVVKYFKKNIRQKNNYGHLYKTKKHDIFTIIGNENYDFYKATRSK